MKNSLDCSLQIDYICSIKNLNVLEVIEKIKKYSTLTTKHLFKRLIVQNWIHCWMHCQVWRGALAFVALTVAVST